MTVIDRAKEYSEAKLAALWARLAHMIPPEEMVLTCWSYARREASAESDIDFFVITQGPASSEESIDLRSLSWAEPVRYRSPAQPPATAGGV